MLFADPTGISRAHSLASVSIKKRSDDSHCLRHLSEILIHYFPSMLLTEES